MILQAPYNFVNGFCTTENIPLFVSYFPYIVFLGPAILAVLERFFSKYEECTLNMQFFTNPIAIKMFGQPDQKIEPNFVGDGLVACSTKCDASFFPFKVFNASLF